MAQGTSNTFDAQRIERIIVRALTEGATSRLELEKEDPTAASVVYATYQAAAYMDIAASLAIFLATSSDNPTISGARQYLHERALLCADQAREREAYPLLDFPSAQQLWAERGVCQVISGWFIAIT